MKTRGVGYLYTCLSRKKKHSLSRRLGEIFSHKAISLAQLCGLFTITEEVFQAQDPILVAQQRWMDYMHEIAFSDIRYIVSNSSVKNICLFFIY